MKKIAHILSVLCALFSVLCAAGAAHAAALPDILSESDTELYARIFELQSAEKIADAKKLESEISDPILMGDVLHQRYMSKTYKTTAAEISKWMDANYAAPGADTIYKLAQRRGVKTRAPKLPATTKLTSDSVAQSENWTAKKYGGDVDKRVGQMKSALRKGHTKIARNILEDRSFKSKVTAEDYGRLCGRLAFVYYADGNFEMAQHWGKIAADAKSEYGLWTLGLSAYKNGEFANAQKYFETMLSVPHINEARKQESLFWAGRAADAAGNAAAAKKHWKTAAARPQTFYGALSSAALGAPPRYDFFEQDWSGNDTAELMKTPFGARALAMLQIGEKYRAEQYLRYLISDHASDHTLHAAHAVAGAAELPRVSMQVSAMLRDREITEIDPNIIYNAQYPLPDWEPMGGWSIDRALLFAITRQESAFKTTAKSVKGASGLMQIMPKTAKGVAKMNNVEMAEIDMSNPEHNMFLGQQHIVDLLAQPGIDNNIIKMLIAYNSGPGAITKWEKKFATDDPILYIESFPNVETRTYVKRVLSNLWLYRARLGQANNQMQTLANGEWPRYESSDSFVRERAAMRTQI